MAITELHAELLLGKRVVDSNGEKVGRIEEIRAEAKDGELVVTEYHTGGYAMLERLAAAALGEWVYRVLHREGPGHAISWDEMDLSDPEHPRARCPRSKLRRREH
jgi:PRC-barrel domain